MNIGFIGIGQMGKHMSRRILEGGYDLVVHDLRREAALPLLEKGARWADSPKEVAQSCRIVLSSLPGPQDVEQVVYGPNGLIEAWQERDIYVDMSTNSPSTIKRIAETARNMGVAVLDAPVTGGTRGAESGTLAIMVGGDLGALDRVRKVLETMSQGIFPVGDVGCGNIAKLVNNMISLACSSATSEGFVLGVKAGIDPQTLWEIIRLGTGNSWALQQYPQTVFKGDFEPRFRISLACKDMKLAMELAKEQGLPLPVGSAAEQKLIEAKAAGLGEKAVDAVILRLEQLAGVQVRLPKKEE